MTTGGDVTVDSPIRISLISGTKAQFIKMMPIAWEMEKRGVPYRLIDTGQHESISSKLRREYGVRSPDVYLGDRYRDVNSIGRGVAWLASNMFQYVLRGSQTRDRLFGGDWGVALVHGDTASTVLGALVAKRAGQKVMHIEAGLRSWKLLNPFPEELVRILVMRMSDYLIAPSPQAHANLGAMSVKGRSWCIAGNTGMDVIASDLRTPSKQSIVPEGPYGVFTIHRMETLYSRRRLEMVVDAVLAAREKVPVLFVQHAPTARRLTRYGMLEILERADVRLLNLMDHREFVHVVNGADFLVTDGGSVQEEAAYLGVPCLLMRMATERSDGLGENVVLSEMKLKRIRDFFADYRQYRRSPVNLQEAHPSAQVVDILLNEIRVLE